VNLEVLNSTFRSPASLAEEILAVPNPRDEERSAGLSPLEPIKATLVPGIVLLLGQGDLGGSEGANGSIRRVWSDAVSGWSVAIALIFALLLGYGLYRRSRRQATNAKFSNPLSEFPPSAPVNRTAPAPPSPPPLQAPVPVIAFPRPPPDAPEFRPGSTLIVDDRKYNRAALATLLEALGSEVQTATTPAEAFALSGAHQFDLILLAYSSPNVNAREIARHIRAQPGPSAQAWFLATTDSATPEKRMQCLMSGIDELLALPVTKEQLRQTLVEMARQPGTSRRSDQAEALPADPLANLKLLATRKRVSFLDEVNLYLSEFESELLQVAALLAKTDASGVARQIHLLRGRCAFIQEAGLEPVLASIGHSATQGQWDAARRFLHDALAHFSVLRLRLVASAQGDQLA
jgi:CheY-like chemotaxis protein